MTAPTETPHRPDYVRCGCCGREVPANRAAELGVTPGTFICAGCATWAGRRAGRVRSLLQVRLPWMIHRIRQRRLPGTAARTAIPVLPSTDLDRTSAFYAAAGYVETGRYPGYLLLNSGNAELHFETERARPPARLT